MLKDGQSDFILEKNERLEDMHFRKKLKEVYPQLQKYEKDLRKKIEHLNQDLSHVQTQIKAIRKVLKET